MSGKYVIPNPLESSESKQQFKGAVDTAIPIAAGKVLHKLPADVQEVADRLLYPPSPQDLIREFLFKTPDAQPKIPAKQLNIPKPENTLPMQPLGGNALGGDMIYHRLEISAKSFTAFDGAQQGYPDMIFNTVLIKCRQHKNIVVTEIQGSDEGAVFEYSGLNSYDVELNITLTKNQNGVYPGDLVDNLIKLCEAQVSVKVDSWYLQHMNIFELVLIDYDIPQEPGGISQQNITIQARSNKRGTLIIQ